MLRELAQGGAVVLVLNADEAADLDDCLDKGHVCEECANVLASNAYRVERTVVDLGRGDEVAELLTRQRAQYAVSSTAVDALATILDHHGNDGEAAL